MFKEELTEKALPKHKLQDYKIVLQEGKKLTFRLLYQLLAIELNILKNYIKENLAKGFIRELKLLAGYLVFFALKKDSKL